MPLRQQILGSLTDNVCCCQDRALKSHRGNRMKAERSSSTDLPGNPKSPNTRRPTPSALPAADCMTRPGLPCWREPRTERPCRALQGRLFSRSLLSAYAETIAPIVRVQETARAFPCNASVSTCWSWTAANIEIARCTTSLAPPGPFLHHRPRTDCRRPTTCCGQGGRLVNGSR